MQPKTRSFLTPPKPCFSHFSILTHCHVSHLAKPQSELHLWVSPLFSSIQLTADNLSLLAAQYCHHTVFFRLPVLPCTNAIFTAVFRVFPNPFVRCYLDNSLSQHFLVDCHSATKRMPVLSRYIQPPWRSSLFIQPSHNLISNWFFTFQYFLYILLASRRLFSLAPSPVFYTGESLNELLRTTSLCPSRLTLNSSFAALSWKFFQMRRNRIIHLE